MQQPKKKNMQTIFFPYLPTQPKIQGRGTANKQFFKDGLTIHVYSIKDLLGQVGEYTFILKIVKHLICPFLTGCMVTVKI